jgi:hypothetical protein
MSKIVSCYLLLSCLFCFASIAQESDGSVQIPFELTSHNNIAIKGLINDTDSVVLMFHTAASSLTLTTEISKSLTSVNWTEETEVNSWGGSSNARFSESNKLTIGTLSWDSLQVWETQNSGPTTDGKFGPNLFDGYVIEIDFDHNLITLHRALPEKISEYDKTELIYEDEFMFIEGTSTIDGKDYENRFLIHSGYGGTVLYDDEFVAQTQIGSLIKITDEKDLKDSYGNVLKTKKGSLPQFTLGNEILADLTVGFFEGSIGRQTMSVMGGDLIKRFNWIISIDRSVAYMQPNQLWPMAFSDR